MGLFTAKLREYKERKKNVWTARIKQDLRIFNYYRNPKHFDPQKRDHAYRLYIEDLKNLYFKGSRY